MLEQAGTLRLTINEDDEIIARIDECERIKAECSNKSCPFAIMIAARIEELKRALIVHMLP